MARRTHVEPTPIVRPPLTPNDAMRASGMLPHAFGRPDFLRKTVDVIDRAHPDPVERLNRFVQDWQFHAKAKVLVELGETLGWLIEELPTGEADEDVQERSDVVDAILAKVPGFDVIEDLDPEYLADVMNLLNDLAEKHKVEPDEDGIKALREKLIDADVVADEGESVAEVRAELEQAEAQVKTLKADAEVLRAANALLRQRMVDVSKIVRGDVP